MAEGNTSASGAAGAALLDEDYLARLAAQIGSEAVAEILADTLVEIEERTALIAEHAWEGDLDALRPLVHDLVSIAGHVGLTRLSAAAAEAQRRLRAKPPPQAAEIYDASVSLLRLAPESCECMRRRIGRPARGDAATG